MRSPRSGVHYAAMSAEHSALRRPVGGVVTVAQGY
jgi:hypothetical protein